MQKLSVEEQLKVIKRGTVEIISEEDLKARLQESLKNRRPLVIKAGFDPTAPDIHLGHTVLLKKLRTFQDLGHRVFFLIGDFTAQIGDPSGRDQTRTKMNREDIKRNAATYKKQVFKILDERKTKVVFNSSWLSKMNLQNILELSSFVTVAQMLARADFKQRFEEKTEISILEFLYPLLQAYDSVYLKADVELGGTDQKFNLLMGRQLQIACGQKPQAVIMTPLLEGTDGINKMSKSLGNYIGINESASQIFGKTMSVPDVLMYRYYEVLTDVDLEGIKKLPPMQAKKNLAKIFIERFYDRNQAARAEEEFNNIFSKRQTPSDLESYQIDKDTSLCEILVKSALAASGNEARRLIKQGAVTIDEKKILDVNYVVKEGGILKAGKRRFLKIVKA
ncbi:MAG: tyrosine--tRNA ligase [Candidatus Omnitrophica bacterium]|nr:tyrosine--tRNA ligase [Candidatus Omnitrophota bacterium]HOX54190.1 tyrosine--tRNA ligase [Candidatus Omnitrophota bacterium]